MVRRKNKPVKTDFINLKKKFKTTISNTSVFLNSEAENLENIELENIGNVEHEKNTPENGRKVLPGSAISRKPLLPWPRFEIPKATFRKIVRTIAQTESKLRNFPELKFHVQTLDLLQEAVENYLLEIFKEACVCASHEKRSTLRRKDILLAHRIRSKD